MAFETFLTADKQKPKKSRRILFAVSLAVHAALLAVGVASSFASVEELAPKNGNIVTFIELPVPPPPPAGKSACGWPRRSPSIWPSWISGCPGSTGCR